MAICVKSEIGPLKKVLLHRPGQELEHLVPEELERLLFDDIPYLKLAQQEHDTFAAILRRQSLGYRAKNLIKCCFPHLHRAFRRYRHYGENG